MRGQGWGTRTLAAYISAVAKAAAKKIGWDTIELHLRAGNDDALAFYKSQGFKRTGTYGTYRDGATRLVMKSKI